MSDLHPESRSDTYAGIRLVQFSVEKLFDEFTYAIPLNIEHHVTAIIAPNGTGKTLCLRMIAALFERRWSVFSDNVFSRIEYRFNEGTIVEIQKVSISPEIAVEPDANRSSFSINVKTKTGDIIEQWTPRLPTDPRRASQIDRYLPYVYRISPSTWRDRRTGAMYNLSELLEEFGEALPDSVRAGFFGKNPEILTSLTKQIDCHLIETQRLLILRDESSDLYHELGRRSSTLAISRKAQALREIISQQINIYATLSQSLDRSFPRRVISHPTTLSPEDLRSRLHDLDVKRKELMEAGILDTEADESVALPEGPLESAISRVLSVYADDTRQKLESLSNLLAKIKLFKELIDQRFLTKDVRVSRQNGIEVIFKNRKVPIERLSSGEQHQLVLFFELLFEIKQNALILIDEPELSLHVAWQKKFISDLMKIIELNRFDVVLATHSPQLVGRWEDLIVELGDIYEGNDDDC